MEKGDEKRNERLQLLFLIYTGIYLTYHSEISDTLLESKKPINFLQLERMPVKKHDFDCITNVILSLENTQYWSFTNANVFLDVITCS